MSLIILTKPPFFNILSSETYKRILKNAFNKVRGPSSVTSSLIRGLNELGYKYKHNPDVHSISIDDTVWVNESIDALTWAIKNKHMYKKLVVGPNLVITPKDHNAIITNDAIDIILQPSLWTKQFLLSFEPRLEHKIKLWPAGVEIPKESTLQKTIDVLIYSKNKMKYKLLETICNELKQKQLTYTILEYGSFKQATYFKKLNEAKMLIYLSNSESQGLALQEAWARDIPTLVFNRGYYEYKGNHFVNEHISAPYLNNMTGTFFNEETFSTQFPFFLNNLDRFTPKKYVEQNLSDRVCAEKFLDTVLAS
jgi:hypothetical protein